MLFSGIDAPGLTDDERMELIAQAARAAVEKFELEQREEEELVQKEKDLRNVMKIELQEADILDAPTFTEEFDDESNESEAGVDYESLTVAELKDILRSRGLKVSGRKAELIARLESS